MIDTISLTIPESDFRIMDHSRFSPNTENLFRPPYIKLSGAGIFKATNNATKKDVEKAGYLPRLTLIKALRRGGYAIFLKIEFSVPKLLFGNNFDEVDEFDFGEVCWKLKEDLQIMGVSIADVKVLADAEVSTVHYSKNIVLTDYTTPYTYLNEIRKVNIHKTFDTNQTDFRNEGHAVRYHSNDFEVVFYDKLKDLEQAKKSEKRAVEKDNYCQLSLFEQVETVKPFEVLRIEVRIGSRRKLKHLLNKNGFDSNARTFIAIFSRKISKKILTDVMDNIVNLYPAILKAGNKSIGDLVVELQLNNPRLGFSQLLKFVGAAALLDEQGIRVFRETTKRFGKSHWYRLHRQMNELNYGSTLDPLRNIQNKLLRFEKCSLESNKF